MPSQPPAKTPLPQTFTHETPSHTLTIHYTTLGSPNSPSLILIHGTPWSSLVYHPLALSLSRTFHVHLFDNPGFGASPIEQERSTDDNKDSQDEGNQVRILDADLSRQTSAYAALYRHWRETSLSSQKPWTTHPPHVIAHDHGGLMALRSIVMHECVYRSVLLMDVVALSPLPPKTPETTSTSQHQQHQPHALFETVAKAPRESYTGLPKPYFAALVEAYIAQASFYPLPSAVMGGLSEQWTSSLEGKEGFIRQLRQAHHRYVGEVEPRYGEIKESGVPVKVLWGKEDRWIGVETAQRLGEVLGAKEIVIVDEAGHLIMYDQPTQVGAEIAVWLMKVEAGLL